MKKSTMLFIIIFSGLVILFGGLVTYQLIKNKKEIPHYVTIRGEIAIATLGSIQVNFIREFFDYINNNTEIKHVIIRIHSVGGPAPNALQIVSIMDEFKRGGGYVECHVYGTAMSAAFIVFINGDNRLVAKTAAFAIHNINAGGEDLSTLYFMDLMVKIMADRSKLSITEVKELIKDTGFIWLTPTELIEYGFADGFIK